MTLMGLIPARGGSKGIPRKNLVPLGGRPLIEYTITAAMQSQTIDEIFISSDDEEIIDFCRSMGLDVSYIRPKTLSKDHSGMVEVILDAIEWIKKKRKSMAHDIMLLQPTSPLRTKEDIDEAYFLFKKKKAYSLISVHVMTEHPYECIELNNEDWHFLAEPETPVKSRQEYKDRFFFINGAIYLFNSKYFQKTKRLVIPGETELYEMPPCRGIDINDMLDLQRAEAFLTRP